MYIQNDSNVNVSLQVSNIYNVEGEYESNKPFLVKIKSDSETTGYIDLDVIPFGQNDIINTRFYEGWNPELLKKIIAPATVGFQVQVGC